MEEDRKEDRAVQEGDTSGASHDKSCGKNCAAYKYKMAEDGACGRKQYPVTINTKG
jgi:hypothetical protein